MNRSLPVFFLIVLLSLACDGDGDSNGVFSSSTSILGSGVMVSEDRSVPPFNGVDLQAVAGVTIFQGAPQSVHIEADDNIIDHITTEVSGGVLIIASDAYYDSRRGVRLVIRTSSLQSLQLTGVGTMTATNIDSGGLLRAAQTGVGTINLSGTSDALDASLAGSGNIEAQGLLTRRSTVDISGEGDCRITATEQLEVTITGVGDVYYAGDPPTVLTNIPGVGQVIPT